MSSPYDACQHCPGTLARVEEVRVEPDDPRLPEHKQGKTWEFSGQQCEMCGIRSNGNYVELVKPGVTVHQEWREFIPVIPINHIDLRLVIGGPPETHWYWVFIPWRWPALWRARRWIWGTWTQEWD